MELGCCRGGLWLEAPREELPWPTDSCPHWERQRPRRSRAVSKDDITHLSSDLPSILFSIRQARGSFRNQPGYVTPPALNPSVAPHGSQGKCKTPQVLRVQPLPSSPFLFLIMLPAIPTPGTSFRPGLAMLLHPQALAHTAPSACLPRGDTLLTWPRSLLHILQVSAPVSPLHGAFKTSLLS